MGERFFSNRIPDCKKKARNSFIYVWPKEGIGRYHKRRLNKAWRRYWKLKLAGRRARMPVHLVSGVSQKGW